LRWRLHHPGCIEDDARVDTEIHRDQSERNCADANAPPTNSPTARPAAAAILNIVTRPSAAKSHGTPAVILFTRALSPRAAL
jgi:hypothetical protein